MHASAYFSPCSMIFLDSVILIMLTLIIPRTQHHTHTHTYALSCSKRIFDVSGVPRPGLCFDIWPEKSAFGSEPHRLTFSRLSSFMSLLSVWFPHVKLTSLYPRPCTLVHHMFYVETIQRQLASRDANDFPIQASLGGDRC